MLTADIQILFSYNYWANERIVAAAARVSEAQYLAPAAVSYGSLRGTLVHELSVEWLWRMRMEGASPAVGLTEVEFPTLQALLERWRDEERAMRSFLAMLSDEDIQRTLHFRRTNGEPGAKFSGTCSSTWSTTARRPVPRQGFCSLSMASRRAT